MGRDGTETGGRRGEDGRDGLCLVSWLMVARGLGHDTDGGRWGSAQVQRQIADRPEDLTGFDQQIPVRRDNSDATSGSRIQG